MGSKFRTLEKDGSYLREQKQRAKEEDLQVLLLSFSCLFTLLTSFFILSCGS